MNDLWNALLGPEPPSFEALRDRWQRHLPLLADLETTPQDPEWHGEGNVAVHCAMVLAEVRRLAASEPLTPFEFLTLQIAAVLHDIGKPLTTRTREINGRIRVVSPHHAEEGRNWLALRIPELGLPVEVERDVLALTAFHHQPRRLVQDEAAEARWRWLARCCPPRQVQLLELADLRGRQCPDLDEQIATMDLFRLRCEELNLWTGDDPWQQWRHAIDEAFPSRPEAFRRHAFQHAVRDAEHGRIQSVEEAVARAWNLGNPAPELTLLCGPSGAGKSEWIERQCAGASVISLDRLREQLAGKRADQSMNGQILQAAKEALKASLRSGGHTVWDATSLRRDMRAWIVQLGLDYGARVSIVALQTPASVLATRNRKRDHPVPPAVLQRQLDSLEWPSPDEAHEIVVIRSGA